jgi:hypothetical protein
MTNRALHFILIATVSTIGLSACDSPTASNARPDDINGPRANVIPTSPTLDAEIRALVTNAFPKGQATSILAKWDQVLRAIASEPKMVLKGKLEPGTAGRAELIRTIQYIQLKKTEATPPTGETRDHFLARLVLDMSLYVYGGANVTPPPMTSTSDVAFKLVNPGTADTVVTPASQAAVAFASTSVSEPTVVVVTPDTAYYPDNCSGPLDTHVCQYPRFYKFNVFPDVRLDSPAKVQVCHVDAGSVRRPLADHNRFVFAHDKPADAANYVPGGQIIDNIEVLPLVTMNVTACTAVGGTTYNTALAPTAGGFTRLAWYAKKAATFLFVPKDAQAIDVGMGGSVDMFSNFAVVDTLSKPDLAQPQSGAYFAPLHTQLVPGDAAQIQAWSIVNLGSGTSGAFTSDVIVATDSLLTNPVSTIHLGGAASLVPVATYAYPAMTVPMPAASGTYFVGTRINSTAADSSKADDLVSFRMTVANPAAPLVNDNAWTAAGPGTFSVTPATGSVALHYDVAHPYDYSPKTFTFTTTAAHSGTYHFTWGYTGLHSWFQAYAQLVAFANGPSGEQVVTLQPNTSVYDNFSFSGSGTLQVYAGYTWGVRATGVNYDSSQILTGTVTLSDPVIIP